MAVGGNDALGHAGVLNAPVRTVGEGLARLSRIAFTFERGYRAMPAGVIAGGPRAIVCTIYNGVLPAEQAPART